MRDSNLKSLQETDLKLVTSFLDLGISAIDFIPYNNYTC